MQCEYPLSPSIPTASLLSLIFLSSSVFPSRNPIKREADTNTPAMYFAPNQLRPQQAEEACSFALSLTRGSSQTKDIEWFINATPFLLSD
ncbi:hypothetical protein Hypma_004094 [Hypsizygus marmoreus]|uniref:Uncharacterized protein n=1 Tax=Hypsizygus marmoreus TaxID=39966 RepID=A0A369K490_HYPMA|nr:hypothetical protein Hypma_004094 [Hypsizygus marmoreus]